MNDRRASYGGRVAVVTGGASGIGRELVLQLAAAGARVVIADRNHPAALELEKTVAATGGSASAAEVDVASYDQVCALVDRTEAVLGPVELLINNAGSCVLADMRDFGIADWRKLLDTNVNGVMNGILASYPRMVARGNGHIVNVASVAGLAPVPFLAAYAATKHAVVGLSLSLRAEAEALGVRVSVACPGSVETPLHASLPVLTPELERLRERSRPRIDAAACARRILEGVARNQALIVVAPGHRLVSALAGTWSRLQTASAARRVRRFRGVAS